MINLALRTEYSFQRTYGYLKNIVSSQESVVGIADLGNTFSHSYLSQECKLQGKKPIFGVRLMVVRSPEDKVKPRGQYGPEYIFLAKNHDGLIEIRKLVSRSIECMYYRRHIGLVDVWKLSDNVIVIAQHFDVEERIDYIGVTHGTSPIAMASSLPKVAINNNQMQKAEDRQVYQLMCGSRKAEKWSHPTHILSEKEWLSEFGDVKAIENTHSIADQCNVELKRAEPVKYHGKCRIRKLCLSGARKLGVNLKDPVYHERIKRELALIREKDFVDYFMIVSEMISKAKETMLVGPGRGSSGGSLVCYLMGITSLDPIRWGLLFDRFIDINRHDMPDIDVDFPDTKRQSVIEELVRTNGSERVKNIATISRMKPRGAIGDFAKELDIPMESIESMKNSIIEVSSGDARFGMAMSTTFQETDIGRNFIRDFPSMELVTLVENHARHSGKHAAGILVSTEPLVEFASIDNKDNTVQIEGKQAEEMGLLKIDCLGLATLGTLEEISLLAGFDFRDFYSIEYNCDKTFKLFRDMRVKGIFQFEGNALTGLCHTIKVRQIEDIIAITALARPGPLHSGGAAKFAKIHSGEDEMEFIMDNKAVEDITRGTMGVIIYQEQVMRIMREVGGFPWDRVSSMRKIISKKGGKEAIEEFHSRFISGAKKNGVDESSAESAWSLILEFSQYGFNRSHAVAYGMISYWTAWCKAHYPMEFLVANLNSGDNTESKKRLIREMKRDYDFEIIPFDENRSSDRWRMEGTETGLKNVEIIGGLTNVDGIGVKNANVIMRKRGTGETIAKGIAAKMKDPKTSFDILYPCEHYWGDLFLSPNRYGLYERPTEIINVRKRGGYLIVARLMKKNVRDLNELQNVIKRGGETYEDKTKLLNITVEDDTASILCRIGRDDFSKIGETVAEDGEEEKDWYLIKGKIAKDEIIFLFISEIFKLGDGYSENETIRDI